MTTADFCGYAAHGVLNEPRETVTPE